MDLKGKKGFCFIALKHHGRFLFPVTRALEARGMKILYPTASAESPFEITLIEQGLPHHHTFSYITPEVARQTEAAYRQIRTVWKERLLESSILHHFTLSLQDKALRMHIENFYLFRRMFEVEKPDLVLALHELGSWGKILGYLCHEMGVPFITFQEGLYWGPAEINRFHTEYSTACLLWGEATREILIRSGGCAEKMFNVGNTHLATAIEEVAAAEAIRQSKKDLNISNRDKVATVIMGGLGYGTEFHFPEALLDWARRTKGLTLVFKWHPLNNKTMIDRIQEGFKDIRNIRSVQKYDTYRLLAASDLCVSFGNSTTGLEALAFGKPLLEVHIPGQVYSFTAQGVAEPVASLADVPEAVEKFWQQGLPPGRSEKVREYLAHHLFSLDGKSVDRTVDVIENVLAAREEQKHRSVSRPLRRAGSGNGNGNGTAKNFVCSIVIPFSSSAGVVESLLGVASHTPANVSYECILASSADAQEDQTVVEVVNGDIHLVRSPRASIASLCNLAAGEAKGRYLCFLSPGLVPQPGWLEALIIQMETEEATGVVGCQILYTNGLIAHAGIAIDFNFNPSLLYQLLPADFAGANKTRKTRAVAGCLLVRREVFDALGGFDGKFGGSLHDIDFCLQAGLDGWQTLYVPESVLVSLKDKEEEMAEADRLRFHAKWVGHLWPDQGSYWQEDGLDNQKLCELYEGLLQEKANPDPRV